MEQKEYGSLLVLSLLGLISFGLCTASEFKKTKRKDLKLDGKFCYLPGSNAFGLGIWALISVCVAQIIGNLVICRGFCSQGKGRSCCQKTSPISLIALSLSWISFGMAVVLIGAATSMNTRQPYGKGWLDGECYMAKDGVFMGGGIVVLVSVGSTIASIIMGTRKEPSGTRPKGLMHRVDGEN